MHAHEPVCSLNLVGTAAATDLSAPEGVAAQAIARRLVGVHIAAQHGGRGLLLSKTSHPFLDPVIVSWSFCRIFSSCHVETKLFAVLSLQVSSKYLTSFTVRAINTPVGAVYLAVGTVRYCLLISFRANHNPLRLGLYNI